MNIRIITYRIKFDLPTSEITKKRHLNRIQAIADSIEQRFEGIKRPEQIKLKHMQFIRNQWYQSQEFSETTIKDYNRSMCLMISALGRKHWLPPLGLEKDHKKGGRPTAGRVIRSKSKN